MHLALPGESLRDKAAVLWKDVSLGYLVFSFYLALGASGAPLSFDLTPTPRQPTDTYPILSLSEASPGVHHDLLSARRRSSCLWGPSVAASGSSGLTTATSIATLLSSKVPPFPRVVK